MDKVIAVGKFLLMNWDAFIIAIVTAVASLGSALVALAMLFAMIPGEQPEKMLYKWAEIIEELGNWLSKFSRKKKEVISEDK